MKYLICLAALLWAGMKLTAADIRGEKRNVSICGRPEND